MKLLVTGLSGLVGSRFQKLYGHKHEMVNLDLAAGVNITNQSQVEEVFKSHPEAPAVIHLAAFTNVSAAHEQIGDKDGACYQVNVTGTENVVKAAALTGKYLVHISTDYVFDGTKETAYTEADDPNPIEWYGQTKLWAEEKVRKECEQAVILRLAFPYQANPVRPDFLQKMRDQLAADTLPPAFADHVITPTLVDDLVAVFDYCVSHRPTGLYHAVGSSSHTDYELALVVKEIFGLPGTVREGSLKAYLEKVNRPYQQTMRVSNDKLKTELGLTMRDLKSGLTEVVQQLS